MKHLNTLFRFRWIYFLALILLCTSCEKLFMDEDIVANPTSTFEYMWTRVDQQYACFDVKNVDWNSIHSIYAPKVYDAMSNDSLFHVMADMLNELNDGHVNLTSSFDISRSEEVYTRMYMNSEIDNNVVCLNYIRPNGHTTGGFRHNTLRDGQIIYIRYASFVNSATSSQLNYIIKHYPNAKGLVLDVRQNGGGLIDNIWNILNLMPNHGQHYYDSQIKSGPGHNDFSTLQHVYAPASNQDYPAYTRPVVVLTDRGSYSATSFFALCARAYNNITTLGDTTGGGLGMPNGGQLPNGWYYRFSITRTLSPDGLNYENGVPPQETLHLDPTATAQGKDNIIERACDIILAKTN